MTRGSSWGAGEPNPVNMSIRRLSAVPLALLVAVLAHVATFGFEHAPGGRHAGELFGVLGAALLLMGLAAFFRAVLFGASAGIAAMKRGTDETLALAAAGFGCYGLLELAEGRLPPGGVLPVVGVLLAAVLVAAFARASFGVALGAAHVFSNLVLASRARCRGSFWLTMSAPSIARSTSISQSSRERAPPRFA